MSVASLSNGLLLRNNRTVKNDKLINLFPIKHSRDIFSINMSKHVHWNSLKRSNLFIEYAVIKRSTINLNHALLSFFCIFPLHWSILYSTCQLYVGVVVGYTVISFRTRLKGSQNFFISLCNVDLTTYLKTKYLKRSDNVKPRLCMRGVFSVEHQMQSCIMIRR